jgi:molybdopterin synthase catalytic subunit
MIEIKLSEQLLRIESIHAVMNDLECGATNAFIGTVRSHNGSKKVLQLEFEAKESMAHKELYTIAKEASHQWPTQQILIHHRVGVVELGDIPVIVAVSTPHRADSFAACQYIIDQLKKRVPIWKKERYRDGEIWVSAHP